MVIGGTALAGSLLPLMLSTAEGAAQVPPARVAGMGQKANPTMQTVRDTAPQMRMRRQQGVEGHLIVLNKRLDAIVLMPVLAKSKNFRDGDHKRARFSVMIGSLFCTPSSYRVDVNASTGRARIFFGLTETENPPSLPSDHLKPHGLPGQPQIPTPHILKELLGKRKHALLLSK